MTATSHSPNLRGLMAIADRYARKLVADVGPPCAVLLIERAGALEIVTLDDPGRGAAARARGLIAQHRATSAALLVEVRTASSGRAADAVFWILGETVEGVRDERRFRVRPCGRGRRLTPLTGGEDLKSGDLSRPLFLVHAPPRTAADVPGDSSAVAAGGGLG